MIALLAVVFASASASTFPYRKTAPLSQVQHGEAQSWTTSNCPDKWLDASFVDMGCLLFNTTQIGTWEEANRLCQMSSNSTLVDITTEVQMGFLQMELDVIANAEGTTHSWWTAGTDLGIEGRWIWATTLTAVEDFVWLDANYPTENLKLNCLSLHHGFEYLGYDENCDAARFPICQMK